MKPITPKQHAERRITVVGVISDLQNGLVAMRTLEHAETNTPTRDAYAAAKAHVAAALGGIELLQREARKKPVAGEIENFLMADRKRAKR